MRESFHLSFGFDIGIASCGWAALQWAPDTGAMGIEKAGVWMFQKPETDKERKLTNEIRRTSRLLRRVIRRRRRRLKDIGKLFAEYGFPVTDDSRINPWQMRFEGLNKVLTPGEWAAALRHLAKRRGFQSNKRKAGEDKEGAKMLKALKETAESIGRYRTVGDMLWQDEKFSNKKRNRDGDYSHTMKRDWIRDEVALLFQKQRAYQNPLATEELEKAYTDIVFFQRPMPDVEDMVGDCPFVTTEKRLAKHAYSFERFRLLQTLVHLRLRQEDGTEITLSPEDIRTITTQAGDTKKLTVKKVRGWLGLPDSITFTGIKPEEENERDIVARKGESFTGTVTLRKALGEKHWQSLQQTPEVLDAIVQTIAFHETTDTIVQKLPPLPEGIAERLRAALEAGDFARFKQAGHLSGTAIRRLIPFMEQGMKYNEACDAAGYVHTDNLLKQDERITTRDQFKALLEDVATLVSSPVARKALHESLKQFWAMVQHYGLPGRVVVEMARDVGHSAKKRAEIDSDIDKRTEERKRLRLEVRQEFAQNGGIALDDVDDELLLRYELWKEQHGRCLYSDNKIELPLLLGDAALLQIDHILPWSRFGDDSFANKTLCFAACNQHKKRQTPFEWLGNSERWQLFEARVEGNKSLKGIKKRNLLLKNAKEREEGFRNRNLNDTRYACKVFAEALKCFYPANDGRRYVYTRPGALTSALRHAWGLEALKKQRNPETGKWERLRDDRHHALDAIVVAAVDEWQIQALTKKFQEAEDRGEKKPLVRGMPMPWKGFREDVKQVLQNDVLVARAERRRARGEGHGATLYQMREREGKTIVYERKAVEKLTEKDLNRLKDADRNEWLKTTLAAWIAEGKPVGANGFPRSMKGHIIRKVRLATTDKPGVLVQRGDGIGAAARGEMARVDVFGRPNKKGKMEYYLVPIYPHQVMDVKGWPEVPNKAVTQSKDEKDWPVMGARYTFLFSLYQRCFVRIQHRKKGFIEGYYIGTHRGDGRIYIAKHYDTQNAEEVGVKSLLAFDKHTVDRLGHISPQPVTGEKRTWRGKVCTSPAVHDLPANSGSLL